MNADRMPVSEQLHQVHGARNAYRHHLMQWLRAQPNLPSEVRELLQDEAEVSKKLESMLSGEVAS